MAEKNISGKIIQAVYTTDELSQEPLCNKVIDDGLVIYEKCEDGKIKSKMGNGVDIWSDLEYLTQDSEIVIFDDGSYKDIKSLINMGSLPYESMYGSSLVVVNNELHLLGGNYYMEDLEGNETDEYLSNHYKYVNGKWIEDVTLPYNISYSHSVCFNNELHIFGGYAYDIETDEGIYYDYHYKLTNGEWVEVGTLPVANDNYKSLSIVYNDKIHYITSMYDDDNNRSDKHYVFDGVEWTELCNAPEEINEYICCGVIFGMLCLLSYNNDIMYGYDDANNCWREMFDVDTPYMSAGQLFNYNQDIYLFTGYDEFLYKLNTDYEFEFVEEIEGTYASVINNNMLTFIGCNVDYNDNNNNSYIHYNYRKHYLVKLENVKKNSIIKITNSFPISSNIQVIENGYKVIENGDVKIGVDFNSNEMTDVNKILDLKAEINDDWDWSEISTYSAYKINELLEEKAEIDDDYSSYYSTYSSNKIDKEINKLLDNVDSSINVVIDEKLPIEVKNLNIISNNDMSELTWCDEYPSLPYDFENGCAVVYNDEIHILGGYNSASYTAHYKFDGVSWTEVSTLPYDFYTGCAVVYNNEIHILGGNTSSNHYKFDAYSSTWINVSTLPYKMKEGSAVVYNNEIHILGGSYSSESMTGHYKFDTSSSTWINVSTLPFSLTDGCALVYNSEIHIFQGSSSNRYHYKFDASSSTWINVSTLPYYYFYDGCAVVYNNEIHILGSSRSSYYKYHYKFNEGNSTWSKVGDSASSLPYNFYDGCTVVWKKHLFILGSGYSSYYKKCCSYGMDILNSSNYKLTEIVLNGDKSINVDIINDNEISNKTTFSSEKIDNIFDFNSTNITIDNYEKFKLCNLNVITDEKKYTWYEEVSLPYDLERGSVVNYKNKLNILGGNKIEQGYKFYNYDGESWTDLNNLPYEFDRGCAVVLNNEIHILGNASYSNSHYKFNIETSSWSLVSNLPYGLNDGSAIVYNNEIHIFGGYSSSYRYSHYKFDNTTSTWVEVSTLPSQFYQGNVVINNNEIHILGSGITDYNKSHYKFDNTTSTWVEVSTLPYALCQGSAIVYNDEIHILGGSYGVKSHYKFDNTTSTWVEVSTLPYDIYNGSAVVYNNEIHILGSGNSSYYKSHYKFNDITSTWVSDCSLPYNFTNGDVVACDDMLYILGSEAYDNSTIISHFEFDPISFTWTEVSTLPYNFNDASAIVYNDEIHILGSSNSTSGGLDYHYKFNGNKWINVSELPYGFHQGSAIIYNDEIHILGNGNSSYNKSHYKFDNTTSTWVEVSTLPYALCQGSAIVYNDEIHILSSNNSSYSKSHYKFDNTTSTWVEVSTLPYGLNRNKAFLWKNELHYIGTDKNVYRFNSNLSWSKIDTVPYNSMCSVIVNDFKIYILGGYTSSGTSKLFYSYSLDFSELNNVQLTSVDLKNGQNIPIKIQNEINETVILYVDENDRLYTDSELTTSITASELFSLYTKGCLVYLSNYEKYFKPISFSPYGYLDIYTSEGIKSLYTSDAEF